MRDAASLCETDCVAITTQTDERALAKSPSADCLFLSCGGRASLGSCVHRAVWMAGPGAGLGLASAKSSHGSSPSGFRSGGSSADLGFGGDAIVAVLGGLFDLAPGGVLTTTLSAGAAR